MVDRGIDPEQQPQHGQDVCHRTTQPGRVSRGSLVASAANPTPIGASKPRQQRGTAGSSAGAVWPTRTGRRLPPSPSASGKLKGDDDENDKRDRPEEWRDPVEPEAVDLAHLSEPYEPDVVKGRGSLEDELEGHEPGHARGEGTERPPLTPADPVYRRAAREQLDVRGERDRPRCPTARRKGDERLGLADRHVDMQIGSASHAPTSRTGSRMPSRLNVRIVASDYHRLPDDRRHVVRQQRQRPERPWPAGAGSGRRQGAASCWWPVCIVQILAFRRAPAS